MAGGSERREIDVVIRVGIVEEIVSVGRRRRRNGSGSRGIGKGRKRGSGRHNGGSNKGHGRIVIVGGIGIIGRKDLREQSRHAEGAMAGFDEESSGEGE